MRQLIGAFIFVVLIIFNSAHAENEEIDLKGSPTGLLTFSKKIPLELDPDNHQILKEDQQNQIKRNKTIFSQKSLPWQKIFLATFAFLILLGLRAFSKTKEKVKKDPIIDARSQAMMSLEALKFTPDTTQNYKMLINILLEYIEDGYLRKIKAKTTLEFLEEIKQNPLPAHFPIKALMNFLNFADLVKFAKEKPTQDELDKAYALVFDIVNEDSIEASES